MTVLYATVAEVKKVTNNAKRPADGYGDRIPTGYQVRLAGETAFRKVLAICYSNAASFYINVGGGARLFIQDSDLQH